MRLIKMRLKITWLQIYNLNITKNPKVFIIYVSFLSVKLKITIHKAWNTQIALLLVEKIIVLAEYSNFANLFLKNLLQILPRRMCINKHIIKWVDGK